MSVTTTEAIVQRTIGGPMKIEAVSIPELRPDEALVEIHASGVCHTDVAMMTGRIPIGSRPGIFGHEGAGVVVDYGSAVTGLSKGDKVLLSYRFCEDCGQCNSGHPAYCESFAAYNFKLERPDGSASFRTADGKDNVYGCCFGQSSFAKTSVVHRSSIVRVPQDTPLELFAPLGCGFMTGAGTVMNVLNVQKDDTVLIMGCGGVGLAAVMAAKIRGAKTIIGVDLVQKRLEVAKEVGCTHVFDGSIGDKLPEEVAKICPPKGVKFAIDTTGAAPVVNTMIKCLGTRGKAAQVGGAPGGSKAELELSVFMVMGREFVGAIQGDSIAAKMVPYLIEQQKQGNFPIEKIIKHYEAKDFEKALHDMHTGETLKPVLVWR